MIKRNIGKKFVKDFKRNKIITLLGPRQVGKTTLPEQITEGVENKKKLTLNCDNEDDRILLQNRSSTELKNLVGGNPNCGRPFCFPACNLRFYYSFTKKFCNFATP